MNVSADVVDILALHLDGLAPHVAAVAKIGPDGRYCPSLQTLIGRSRRFCGHQVAPIGSPSVNRTLSSPGVGRMLSH